MILLFGGAAETGELASALLDAGHPILLSTVSDAPLTLPDHPDLYRRTGPLTAVALQDLIHQRSISFVIDCAHPYAVEAHRTVAEACALSGLPWVALRRPPSRITSSQVERVPDHAEAARRACDLARGGGGGAILLTIGTRNLEEYVRAARAAGIAIHARILNHPASQEAACRGGLSSGEWTAGRGPFSEENTCWLIQETRASVLVTKDGGREGGLPEKLAAAESTGCRVLLIPRPHLPDVPSVPTVEDVIQRVRKELA